MSPGRDVYSYTRYQCDPKSKEAPIFFIYFFFTVDSDLWFKKKKKNSAVRKQLENILVYPLKPTRRFARQNMTSKRFISRVHSAAPQVRWGQRCEIDFNIVNLKIAFLSFFEISRNNVRLTSISHKNETIKNRAHVFAIVKQFKKV